MLGRSLETLFGNSGRINASNFGIHHSYMNFNLLQFKIGEKQPAKEDFLLVLHCSILSPPFVVNRICKGRGYYI